MNSTGLLLCGLKENGPSRPKRPTAGPLARPKGRRDSRGAGLQPKRPRGAARGRSERGGSGAAARARRRGRNGDSGDGQGGTGRTARGGAAQVFHAGTVCTVYTISEGPWEYHDEIDLEFLGNATGQPYTLHTNIFASGVGGREQQFRLWFDPTADYHTYSIVWNPKHILILVDGVAIRDFKNNEDQGVPFPTWQSMRTYGSLWSAEDWATEGGRIKTDWSQAPFVSYYCNYNVTWCQPSPGVAWCGDEPANSTRFDLDQQTLANLQWVQDSHMIYNYCTDYVRFNATTLPKECTL